MRATILVLKKISLTDPDTEEIEVFDESAYFSRYGTI